MRSKSTTAYGRTKNQFPTLFNRLFRKYSILAVHECSSSTPLIGFSIQFYGDDIIIIELIRHTIYTPANSRTFLISLSQHIIYLSNYIRRCVCLSKSQRKFPRKVCENKQMNNSKKKLYTLHECVCNVMLAVRGSNRNAKLD